MPQDDQLSTGAAPRTARPIALVPDSSLQHLLLNVLGRGGDQPRTDTDVDVEAADEGEVADETEAADESADPTADERPDDLNADDLSADDPRADRTTAIDLDPVALPPDPMADLPWLTGDDVVALTIAAERAAPGLVLRGSASSDSGRSLDLYDADLTVSTDATDELDAEAHGAGEIGSGADGDLDAATAGTRADDAPLPELGDAQMAAVVEALSRLRVRPGEEGLPPAVLFFQIVGPPMSSRVLGGFSDLIKAGVRGGDVVEPINDRTLVMVCGGLFFPGDLEMIADRIRDRVNAKAPVMMKEAFAVLVGGALCGRDEAIPRVIGRAERARIEAESTRSSRVLIDYGLGAGIMPDA